MSNSFNTVAFITGANRGIGLETARQLGVKGITVVIGSRDLEKGEQAVDLLKSEGINATAIQHDATDSASSQRAYDYFDKEFGKLDILVNNAGIFVDPATAPSVDTISSDLLRTTFDTNFFGVIELTQVLLPLIKKSEAGRIVNLSSILGSLTIHSQADSPLAESKAFAYNSSKTALNAFTVHLAQLLKDTNIKVNSAHPGWVKTEMGGEGAALEIPEGGKTSAQLATLPKDGPTGGFFHLGETLPW